MAIQPIDLQTLFSQVDKVGKIQSDQKDALAVQQATQGVQLQKKTEAQIKSVNRTQDSGAGVDKVHDRDARQKRPDEKGNTEGDTTKDAAENDEDSPAPKKLMVFSDPALGNKIDISG
jgi:hypothetical protein